MEVGLAAPAKEKPEMAIKRWREEPMTVGIEEDSTAWQRSQLKIEKTMVGTEDCVVGKKFQSKIEEMTESLAVERQEVKAREENWMKVWWRLQRKVWALEQNVAELRGVIASYDDLPLAL